MAREVVGVRRHTPMNLFYRDPHFPAPLGLCTRKYLPEGDQIHNRNYTVLLLVRHTHPNLHKLNCLRPGMSSVRQPPAHTVRASKTLHSYLFSASHEIKSYALQLPYLLQKTYKFSIGLFCAPDGKGSLRNVRGMRRVCTLPKFVRTIRLE